MDERLKAIEEATEYVSLKLGGHRPQIGIILGSGLGKLAGCIKDPIEISYTEIPHFVRSTAIGHKGSFISGMLGGKSVLAMQGRFHYYEGYPMEKVVLPVRVMVKLGIERLFVSNAAGGTNLDYKIGDLMIIRDHINLLPNPLIGPNLDGFGPRFSDMTRPYDLKLIALAEQTASELGIRLRKGVYLANSGPTYETPAEYTYYRAIGADAVGMSTIPEVIVARHSDIPVFGMSVITNETHEHFSQDYANDAEEVVRAADSAAEDMSRLFIRMIENI